MKRSQKRQAELEARFRQTRRYQAALVVPLGGALLIVGAASRLATDLGLVPVVLAAASLVAFAAAFSWLNWRCPACRTSLGTALNPTRCPNCGATLRAR